MMVVETGLSERLHRFFSMELEYHIREALVLACLTPEVRAYLPHDGKQATGEGVELTIGLFHRLPWRLLTTQLNNLFGGM